MNPCIEQCTCLDTQLYDSLLQSRIIYRAELSTVELYDFYFVTVTTSRWVYSENSMTGQPSFRNNVKYYATVSKQSGRCQKQQSHPHVKEILNIFICYIRYVNCREYRQELQVLQS